MANETMGLLAAAAALVALVLFGLWDRVRRPAGSERWFRTFEPGTEPAEPTELPGWPGSEEQGAGAKGQGSGGSRGVHH